MSKRIVNVVLVLLSAVALSACVGARHKVEEDIVRDIRFEGNAGFFSGHGDYSLRSQMAQPETSFGLLVWPMSAMITPQALDFDLLTEDAHRLEVYYAHNGWFDAKVKGFEVYRVKRFTESKAGVVDVVGSVDPGEPSVVRSFSIKGYKQKNYGIRGIAQTIERTGYVRQGEQFSLENVEYTKGMFLTKLNENAYPFAVVESSVDVYPSEHAVDIVFTVNPGPTAVFGKVRVRGAKTVSEEVVLETITIKPGEPYSSKKISESTSRLFDLGTFSVVAIKPNTSHPESGEVNVVVNLTEARFKRIRLGAGFEWDAATMTPRIASEYRQVNILNRLIRFDSKASFGYALEADGVAIDDSGLPVYGLEAGLSMPRFMHRDLTIFTEASIEQALQSGQFAYQRPTISGGLSWEVNRLINHFKKHDLSGNERVILVTGIDAEIFDYLDLSGPAEAAAQAIYGSGFRDPYRLITADSALTFDYRDDPLNTHRGSYSSVSLSRSLPFRDDDFDFTSVGVDLRVYKPLRLWTKVAGFPFTAAGRLGLEQISAHNDSTIPYPERVFLGGGNDHRSFRLNQLGAYDCLCTYSEVSSDGVSEATQHYLPQGGLFGGLASAELRYDWDYDISFSTFFDLGAVTDGVGDLSLNELRYGGGVGSRYNSMIGPLRLDLSLRPLYPEDASPESYLRCKPNDEVPRAYDLISQPSNNRAAAFDRSVPVAFNLFLSIGEAF